MILSSFSWDEWSQNEPHRVTLDVPRVRMLNVLSIVTLGFFLGMRHATDPDHVIAVSTIVSRQRSIARSAWVGAFWGLGHTLTILLVGATIILFNLVIPPRVGLTMELAVGLMLIVLSVPSIFSLLRPGLGWPRQHHGAQHAPGAPPNDVHTLHHAPLTFMDRVFGRTRLYFYVRPLIVGIVHGLAGSAAVALLVLTTIREPRWAVAYLLVFGIGTVAGMMIITVSLASTFHFVARIQGFSRGLATASGILSLAFGLAVAYHIGFIDGLFTGHPTWIPR
jgi:high-affinity nickel-transport protein